MKTRLPTVLSTVMKSRRVFRGGTSIDDNDKARRDYYTKLIAECKEEVVQSRKQTVSTRTRKTSKSRIDLLGRRVIMCADVWSGKENEYYNGVVSRKSKYNQDGVTKNGYAVKWHTGEVDFW